MRKTPIIRVDGTRNSDMVCMDCGKPIEHKREAPSGSFLPRCENCNQRRWKIYYSSPSEQVGTGYDWNNPDDW